VRSPRFVAVFLAALILPQVFALGRQFYLGFRPFGREPVRVPLSWDMFATRIERCALTWTPPVSTPVGRLATIRDLAPALEWDVVGDRPEQYEYFARKGCFYALQRTRVDLQCVSPEGRWEALGFDCP
jgi:hypothetical protein